MLDISVEDGETCGLLDTVEDGETCNCGVLGTVEDGEPSGVLDTVEDGEPKRYIYNIEWAMP